MNIVMIGPFGLTPKGTMSSRALPAAQALSKRGHRLLLLMPPWHTPREGGRSWVEAETGVSIEYVSLRGLGWPGLGHLLVGWRLAERARKARPDVVHVFKPKGHGALAGALLRIGPSRRSPALVVDTDDWEGPGGWNELEPYTRAQRWVFARQERWGLRHAEAVTAASRALETLAWATGMPPGRVSYLPNALLGAALERAVPRTGDHAPARHVLLYTRFFEFAPQRPLEVLQRVRAVHPAARLVVAGSGLHGEESRFAELASSMGLAAAVEHRGWVEPAQLAEICAEAALAIYPFDDTLVNRTKSPAKLLQLMAAGVPVVAEAVGEIREVIENGRSGRLVPCGDVEAFAEAVSALLADPAARRSIGAAARQRIAAAYNWEHQVAVLEGVYERAIGARRRGPMPAGGSS